MTASVALVNRSTLVSDADVAKIASAIREQVLRDFAPAWGLAPASVYAAKAPSGASYAIQVVDDPPSGEDGALGWHTEEADGRVDGLIFARATLDAGGSILSGADAVSVTCSHEVLELLLDPRVNLWADLPGGKRQVPVEACDAVESGAYEIAGVAVSNFLLPSWFDAEGKAPFDKLGALARPFLVSAGGYSVVRRVGGKSYQVFGDEHPERRRASRRKLRRLVGA